MTNNIANQGNNNPSLDIHNVVSEKIMDQSYTWLCKQRADRGHNNSVWDLRWRWDELKSQLQLELQTGRYLLSPLASYQVNGEWLSSWTAQDALVLKAVSIALQSRIVTDQYPNCYHLKHAGGIHEAVKQVSEHQSAYQHILRSDAYHYYESIDHTVLLTGLRQHITCPILLDILKQYCERLEVKEGQYYKFNQGIPKGCPLSPLMAAVYLKPLDDALANLGFYCRFMDDWVIMVKTKHQLRKVIKLTHRVMAQLKLKMHPDKTFFGWIKKGFDFLGVQFGAVSRISKPCMEKHQAMLAQRYAQGATDKSIGDYIARWTSWSNSLLGKVVGDRLYHEPRRIQKLASTVSPLTFKEECHGISWSSGERSYGPCAAIGIAR